MLSRGWLLLWCVLLGSAAAVGTAAAMSDATTAEMGNSATFEQGQSDDRLIPNTQEELDPDATVTRIAVGSNSSATWSVTVRVRLDSNESTDGFEAFEREFERNRSQYLGQFRDRMTGVVENAATVTGREMTATAFEAEIGTQEVPRRWGYVTYRFRWQGFAPEGDGTTTVGDVFSGGLFLQDDDILVIEGPPGYETNSVDPAADETDEGQLQWNGPVSFDDQRPQVQFTPDSEGGTEESPSDGDPDSMLPLFVGILIAALIGIGVVYVRLVGGQTGSDSPEPTDTEPDGEQSAAAQTDQPVTNTEAESTLELGELATDEDRVTALLEAEDGRMRQAAIAERLDWSASKTSRVVSEMADDGEIEKLRIGRENVIDLVERDDDDR